jgi:glycosyltransferase involved in cell wall biosynthesis
VIAACDQSDVFAIASHFETCSMATVEAMARGLTIVAFGVGRLPDLLPEISCQMLAEPGDATGWQDVLCRLIAHPIERRRLGRANRKVSQTFPSWEASGAALKRFLKNL